MLILNADAEIYLTVTDSKRSAWLIPVKHLKSNASITESYQIKNDEIV
jgi:hypothetical protein